MIGLEAIFDGFLALTDPAVFAYMAAGFLIGAFFGMVPGLTSVLALALLLPLTYSLDVVSALVMSAAIFMAGMYAGSVTATTINIPGAPSSMMTAIEGHALMKQGQGAKALGHAALASMIGGAVGAVLLMAISPLAAQVALLIRTPGKFSLILFALVVIVIAQRKAIAKGTVATCLGLMIATIGIDVMQPVARFTFGADILVEGIDMMPIVIGAFAISELLVQAERADEPYTIRAEGSAMPVIRRRDFIPRWSEVRAHGWLTYLKGAIIGSFWALLTCFLISFPIGIGAAIYL